MNKKKLNIFSRRKDIKMLHSGVTKVLSKFKVGRSKIDLEILKMRQFEMD